MRSQILLCSFQIRLFYETLYPINAGHTQIGVPFEIDVAVAGFRIGRCNADGHQILILFCHCHCLPQGVHIHFLITDQVVRGQHQHHCLAVLLANHSGSQTDTGSCISGTGLQQDIFLRQLGQLFLYQCGIADIGHHKHVVHCHHRQQTLDGFLDHGFSVLGQREKLLGIIATALGPETFASAACHDYCGHFHE